MRLEFSKYQATGNDFILIDNRSQKLMLSEETIRFLCDRHFGIGADGLIIVEVKEGKLFMAYFNSNGRPGSFCGNGSRCFALFLVHLKTAKTGEWIFYEAYDGPHQSKVLSTDFIETVMNVNSKPYSIVLENMAAPTWFADSGSPHVLIEWPHNPFRLADEKFLEIAKCIRNHSMFDQPAGVNVNLLFEDSGNWYIRTFERGVESETLSCGTGVTAAFLMIHEKLKQNVIHFKTKGGELSVSKSSDGRIILCGPARQVFTGIWN